jgi:hypothetical protein
MPSIFKTELNAYLAEGLPYYIAKHRAIDYHRKFTAREVDLARQHGLGPEDSSVDNLEEDSMIHATDRPDAEITINSSWTDANLLPEERVMFRELFELMVDYCYSLKAGKAQQIGRRWLAQIVREGNLEHLLSEERQRWVALQLKNSPSEHLQDVASLCGYEPRQRSRVDCTFDYHLNAFQTGLREYLREVTHRQGR